MFKDLTIGQYLPGKSAIHRLDPRTKILSSLAFVIIIFLARDWRGYAVLTAFAVVALAFSGVPFRFILRGLRPILFILGLTLILQVFLTPGQALFKIGPLTATREGLTQGLYLSYRLVLLMVVTSLMTLTTSPIALTDGLEKLLNPFRRLGVPAHELAMMMTIALRFIPTLLEETDKIMKAQMARGADFESGNLMARAKSLVPLLVPLFVSAFRRADELATAMEARCYRGGDQRTRMKELRLTPRDFAAGALSAVFFAGVVWLRVG